MLPSFSPTRILAILNSALKFTRLTVSLVEDQYAALTHRLSVARELKPSASCVPAYITCIVRGPRLCIGKPER